MKTEILVLSGSQVVLSQGTNVLVGCKLTANMRTGRAQVEGCKTAGSPSGRVMMSITPRFTELGGQTMADGSSTLNRISDRPKAGLAAPAVARRRPISRAR